MAGDGNVYPVGLIFVGAPGQEEQQTTILPVSDDPGKAGRVTIKQEKQDQSMQMYMQSCSSATSQGKESSVPGSSGVAIKQELNDELELSPEGDGFNPLEMDSERDKEAEDRNSETYWEKRKRFTLAFAAGLRKFIQMHPELLRYGPKKSQGGASATVTSSGAAVEEEEEAMEEDVEPTIPVAPARSPRGRSPRGRRGRGSAAATRRAAAAEPAESVYTPTTRKRVRSSRNSRGAEEEELEQEEELDVLPVGVTIKSEPAEDED